ncbi:MAG: hypothetical protein ASARMPRED_000090 [Alectoria sarmentosa]|nr:MAG: hypothetical protein ASARMPRED_000090 [Alectoria sarmentosa]
MPKAQKTSFIYLSSHAIGYSQRQCVKAAPKLEGDKQSPQATATSHEVSSPNSESANNYLILVTLSGSTNPTMTRLLSLPPSLTFDKLHRVLQISFGWTNSHMHDFNVLLVDDEPGFRGHRSFLALCPNPNGLPKDLKAYSKAKSEVTLADIYEKPEWKDRAAQMLNLGHPAAEDVGGTCGWRGLKEAFKHPRKAENREQVDWYKNSCLNGDKSLDPHAFDILTVNDGLRDAFAENKAREKADDTCEECGKDL